MPSSPRWPQHTSRRSGARSVEGEPASGRSPRQGLPICPSALQPISTEAAPPELHMADRALELAPDDPCPHLPGSRGADSRGRRAQAPRAGGTRSGRSPGGSRSGQGGRSLGPGTRPRLRVGGLGGWSQLGLGPCPLLVSPASRPWPHPSPPDSDTGAALGCTPPGACRRSGSRRAYSHTLHFGSWIRPSTRPRLEEKRDWEQPAGSCAYLPAAFPRPPGPTALTHALQQVPIVVEALLAIALIARLRIYALALLADFRPEQYALVDVCGATNIGRPAASTCRATEVRQAQNM